MSNNEMVSVRRELLVDMVHNQGKRVSAYMPDIAALLAAPANRCGHCGASTVEACNDRGCHFFESGNGEPVPPAGGEPEVERFDFEQLKRGLWRMKADPEGMVVFYEAHRAHVTRLQAEVEKFKAANAELSASNVRRRDREVAARKELDALKAAQGEPVAHTTTGMLEIAKRLPLTGRIGAKVTKDERWNIPLYTSPPAPVAAVSEQFDGPERQRLIAYGRNCGLDEASRVCLRMAYEAYYPPGTRFKTFTPKAQMRLGDILTKAANEIVGLPDGPYERFLESKRKKS